MLFAADATVPTANSPTVKLKQARGLAAWYNNYMLNSREVNGSCFTAMQNTFGIDSASDAMLPHPF